MKKALVVLSCMAFVSMPTFANAQFGNMLSTLKGAGQTSNTGSPEDYINNTTKTAKYIWSASVYLNNALDQNADVVAAKSRVTEINNISNINMLNAQKNMMSDDMNALSFKLKDTEQAKTNYDSKNASQKQAIGNAMFNLALGALSALTLSRDAGNFMGAIKSNPMGYLKNGKDIANAAAVTMVLAKGTGQVMMGLPKLAGMAKIQLPTDANAGQPKDIEI